MHPQQKTWPHDVGAAGLSLFWRQMPQVDLEVAEEQESTAPAGRGSPFSSPSLPTACRDRSCDSTLGTLLSTRARVLSLSTAAAPLATEAAVLEAPP